MNTNSLQPYAEKLPDLSNLPLSARLLRIGVEWLDYELPNNFDPSSCSSEYFRLGLCLRSLCNLAVECLPKKIAYVNFWLSGTTPRMFTPIAAWPNSLLHIAHEVPKAHFPWRQNIAIYAPSTKQLSDLFANVPEDECWMTDIYYRGEHLGFITFVCYKNQHLSFSEPVEIEALLALLRRLVGDAVFALRLEILAAPIKVSLLQPTHQEFCSAAAEILLTGMGVDGVVIRLGFGPNVSFDETASSGLLGERAVSDDGRQMRLAISDRLFKSEIGLGVLSENPTGSTSSAMEGSQETLTEEEIKILGDLDFHGMLLVRLESNRTKSGAPQPLGIISVISRDPRTFTTRDLQLLRTFAQRVADELSLLQAREELDNYKLKLEASVDACTRAELVALLAHDLYIRVMAVGGEVESFRMAALKAIREKRNADYITLFSEKVMKEINTLQNRIAQIKHAHRRLDEKPQIFDVAAIANEVKTTVEPSIRGLQMSCEVTRKGNNLKLFGVAGVWRMILLNLVINSIDAQKELRNKRQNCISINCREETKGGRRAIIARIADEGPGISKHKFNRGRSIFDMGATSKSTGTGLGLPVSRSLADTYFGGSLDLIQEKPAIFQVILFDQAEATL